MSGHEFVGWAFDASSQAISHPAGFPVGRIKGIDGEEVRLHAIWKKAPGKPDRHLVTAIFAVAVLAIVALAACLTLGGIRDRGNVEPEVEVQTSGDLVDTPEVVVDPPRTDGSVQDVTVRDGLADYSWVELKLLSRAIAAAKSDEAGLDIAKEYNLVDDNGKLGGDEKPVVLQYTKALVRVAGFRHDELVSGGVAGITFEFADSPVEHSMNGSANGRWSNAGGWEASDMRAWLNTEFLALLPDDLRPLVEPVRKRTNNQGEVEKDDTSCVTETTDSLWLLSASEVYGKISSQNKRVPMSHDAYDAEGTQYQLYSDHGVTKTSYEFCRKRVADTWQGWWLRSPNALLSFSFHYVAVSGGWFYQDFDYVGGVSPGFCI